MNAKELFGKLMFVRLSGMSLFPDKRGVVGKSIHHFTKRNGPYKPHQGAQEKARRMRQDAAGQLTFHYRGRR